MDSMLRCECWQVTECQVDCAGDEDFFLTRLQVAC